MGEWGRESGGGRMGHGDSLDEKTLSLEGERESWRKPLVKFRE